jgi:hypothetical protein
MKNISSIFFVSSGVQLTLTADVVIKYITHDSCKFSALFFELFIDLVDIL